jgi:integrase
VPINDTLFDALTAAAERATSGFVIEFGGEQVASVKHGFHTAAERAGLAGVTPHVCRHTAATWMAQRGGPLWQVAGMLGHTDATMVAQTYGHHHPDHMADAARALG